MAHVYAAVATDFGGLVLNDLLAQLISRSFQDNVQRSYQGYVYEDVWEFTYGSPQSPLYASLAGTGLVLSDDSSDATSGFITGLHTQSGSGGLSGTARWGMESFSYSAVTLFDAVQTADAGDDLAVLQGILAGADVFDLSAGNDVAHGYGGNDLLRGFGGNDVLDGGTGADTLYGGIGLDTMVGGVGNDAYYVDTVGDTIVETSAALTEIDTVQTLISWTLGGNLERMILLNSAPINATGNALNNFLQGNAGANVLDGLAGNDTLVGGLGNDTYVVDSAGDVIVEASTASSGIDSVRSTVTWNLGANIENLTLVNFSINGYGNELNNVLEGNAGFNVLDGGLGNDTMIGGGGADTYYVDSQGDVVVESEETTYIDRVYSSISWTLGQRVEELTLTGTATSSATGNDRSNRLAGNTAANLLDGQAGDDTLYGGAGDDTLSGGEGDDMLAGEAGNDTFLAGMGVDSLFYSDAPSAISLFMPTAELAYGSVSDGYGGTDVIQTGAVQGAAGSSFDDIMVGSPRFTTSTGRIFGDDSMSGGYGNDHLSGLSGDDHLVGFYGDDTLVGGEGQDTLFGLWGNDVLDGRGGTSFYGGTGAWSPINVNLATGVASDGFGGTDTLVGIHGVLGSSNNDVMVGDDSDNEFNGDSGYDTIDGGSGYDAVYYNDFFNGDGVVVDLIAGTAIQIGSAVDSLTNIEGVVGSSGADNIAGNGSANCLIGAQGQDTLNGGAGNDTLDGGEGDDLFFVDSAGDLVLEAPGFTGGIDTVRSSINWTLGGLFENLTLTGNSAIDGFGNDRSNVLNGNNAANRLSAGNNNDTLSGASGNDTLEGGAGADSLNGGAGADSMTGGTGNDSYVVDSASDVVIETYTVTNEIDTVQSSVTRTLETYVERLTLTGSAAINGTGNNLANVITGNLMANVLSGGNGNDSVYGGVGNDSLLGGSGNDLLSGSAGQDTFRFNTALNATTNVDTLIDFTAADDRIDLDDAFFAGVGPTGALSAGAFHAGSAAAAADDRIIYNAATGQLLFDADGDGSGAAVLFATVAVNTTVTAADFLVV